MFDDMRRSARHKRHVPATLGVELLEDRCLLSSAVAIVTNPISQTVVAGHTASFSAAATGSPTPSVQWEMSPKGGTTFSPLSNNTTFSGVATDMLTITGAATALSGDQFEAVFSNGVGPNPSVASAPATLTVNPVLSIGAVTQATWTVNRPGFDGVMTIAGGIGPYTIASSSGLPTGLTAILGGDTISFTGTPTVLQAFTGSITIMDAVGDQATQTVNITINPLPTISHMSNNNWTEGLATFTGAMTISGGAAPFTIVNYGGLPPGVTPVIVHGNTIGFTGAPSVAKTFTAGVEIEDASGAFATKMFVIDVEPALIIGNLTQDQWTVGQAGYPATMTIGGGTGAYSLVASSGLPTGLSAEVSGSTVQFTGTPKVVGNFTSASVTIADADGATTTQTFAITINPTPTLSALNVLQWTAGMPGYTGTVTITGGTGPYSISSFAYLPFAAAVSGNTVYFTGAAPARTYTDATFTVRDETGATTTETTTITVNQQIGLTGLTNSTWTVGQAGFTGTITVNYGTQPFTITSFSGMPNGLTPVVSGDTIGFTGTPSVAGSFSNGMIALEDAGGENFNVPVNITIKSPPTFTTTAVPVAGDGVGYGTTLNIKGGTGADTFALLSGSLPSGLTLQSNGHIGGTTNAVGTYTFTVGVTDGAGAHASAAFTLAAGPAIALGNLTQTQWTIGQGGFNGTIAVKGGAGPFTLTSFSGLPTGLTPTLSGRTISFTGAPSVLGTFAGGSITVVDPAGYSVTEKLSITINAPPTLGALAAVAWTAGQSAYPPTITISGGTGPFTIVSYQGMPFNPLVSGNTIRFVGAAGAGAYSHGVITLRDQAGAAVTADLPTIVINPVPTLSHMSVNNWTEGTSGFPGALTITGGTGPFTIANTKNVPLGLTPIISGNLVEFTGVPEVAETISHCVITIEDAAGALYTKVIVFDIAPPLTITTTHLPAWRSGVIYSTILQASGGTGGRTFTLTGGTLPTGLTLNSHGKLSGKATTLAPFTFTVTVTDAIGDKSSETFTL